MKISIREIKVYENQLKVYENQYKGDKNQLKENKASLRSNIDDLYLFKLLKSSLLTTELATLKQDST
jgi:hypothetical protein